MKPDYPNMSTDMLHEMLQHFKKQYRKFLADGESPEDYDRAKQAILEIQMVLKDRSE